MDNSMQPILLVLAIAALANVCASALVIRTDAFSNNQRLLQLGVIWIIPLVGAVSCGAFAWHQRSSQVSGGTLDPLYIPSDGGAPEGPGMGFCDCGESSGSNGGGDGGGD
jgi:hypothetical protein